MNIEYHNCTYVLYVLYVLYVIFNKVSKIVRLIVNLFCKIFKSYKAARILTTYFKIEHRNLRSHFWCCVHGSTEYAYAVGAWTPASNWLLRNDIKRTMIFELRMTMGPTIYRVSDRNHDWGPPLHNVDHKRKILPTWISI